MLLPVPSAVARAAKIRTSASKPYGFVIWSSLKLNGGQHAHDNQVQSCDAIVTAPVFTQVVGFLTPPRPEHGSPA